MWYKIFIKIEGYTSLWHFFVPKYFVFSYWPLFTIKTLSIHQSLFCLFKASGRLERGSCKEYKWLKLTGNREGHSRLYHKHLLVFKHCCLYCKGWLAVAKLKPLSLFISLFYHCLLKYMSRNVTLKTNCRQPLVQSSRKSAHSKSAMSKLNSFRSSWSYDEVEEFSS